MNKFNYDINKFFREFKSDKMKTGFKVSDMQEFNMVIQTLQMYGLSTSNFLKNLEELCMQEVNESDLKEGSKAQYFPLLNKLEYCDKNYILHELFHCAANSYGKKTTGVSYTDANEVVHGFALNEGITDLFTSLSDPNYKVIYPLEKMCAEVLADAYGYKIFDYHFDANASSFVHQFNNNEIMLKLIENTDEFSAYFEYVAQKLCSEEVPTISEYNFLEQLLSKILKDLEILYTKKVGCSVEDFKSYICDKINSKEMIQVTSVSTRFAANIIKYFESEQKNI